MMIRYWYTLIDRYDSTVCYTTAYHSAGEKGSSVRNELDLLEVSGIDWAGRVGFLGVQSLVDAPLHIIINRSEMSRLIAG